jgi:hypothetical protein
MRARRRELQANPDSILRTLKDGATKARDEARITLNLARSAMAMPSNLDKFPVEFKVDEEMLERATLIPSPSWWEMSDPTERGDSLRKFWLSLHSSLRLRELAHGVYLTERGKRVLIATSREKEPGVWRPKLINKHFDVLVLLCWTRANNGQPGELLDFVVPRKRYETAWKFVDKKLKKFPVKLARTNGSYKLVFQELQTIPYVEISLEGPHSNFELLG